MKARNIILITLLFIVGACSEESSPEVQPAQSAEKVPSLEEISAGHIELEPVETPPESFLEGAKIEGTYFDASGQIEFRIYSATSGFAGSHTNRIASVGSGFVCIGGGALIHDWTNNKGALLTASYPSSNKESWIASSHDHAVADHHKLTVYAIGMRINGISEATLKSYIYHDNALSSTSQQYPFKQVNLPAGYELLSGGTRINWVHPGNLSVSSIPIGTHAWFSQGKDHLYVSPTTIRTYVVGILRNIPNFGTVDTNVYTAHTFTNAGYSNVTISLNNTGYVLTGVGGSAMTGEISANVGRGRMLYGLKPGSQGTAATSYSKDHIYFDDGTTRVHAIGIKKL